MATDIEAQIDDALLRHMSTFTLPATVTGGIAYPNINHDPEGNPYIRVSIFKNQNQDIDISFDIDPIRRGIFQASVYWNVGFGLITPKEVAGLIKDHFALGTRITEATFTIRIDQTPNVGSDIQEENWVQIPVSIPYVIYP
jgi:hypothetical protein